MQTGYPLANSHQGVVSSLLHSPASCGSPWMDERRLGNAEPLQQILSRLGTVKNPVLFTSTSFSTAMMYFSHFSHDLVASATLIASITGAVVFLSSIVVFLSGFGFYTYAYLQLPASTQELGFLQEAKVALDHHREASQRSSRQRSR